MAIQETAEIFAGQAAAAIQNAELIQKLEQANLRDRRIAETFQRAILSDVWPDLPGLEIGHTYRAALEESVVGGDFYDVFPVTGNRVALMIGDVSGKGLLAAVQTARVKFGVRAFAADDPDPPRIVKRMHDALLQQGGYEGFVTLFLAVYDPSSRSLHYTNAGHEPPLLQRVTGEAEWLNLTGMVVGLNFPYVPEFASETRVIQPGDALVLFTDGFTEARHDRKFWGRPGLLKAWSRYGSLAAPQAANAILDEVIKFARGRLRDDAALVVIRFN
jgi:serine phosphatase RsbU (regulator of sigma subunit)